MRVLLKLCFAVSLIGISLNALALIQSSSSEFGADNQQAPTAQASASRTPSKASHPTSQQATPLSGARLNAALRTTLKGACPAQKSIGQDKGPLLLYVDLGRCANAQRYDEGVLLYALAGVYQLYDKLRTKDDQASNALGIARAAILSQIDHDKWQVQEARIRALLEHPASREKICRQIATIGPPVGAALSLLPSLASMQNTQPDKGTNAKAAWIEARQRYLKCSGL